MLEITYTYHHLEFAPKYVIKLERLIHLKVMYNVMTVKLTLTW